ncbi:MAG TPA: flagellar assembly protein FliH [Rectinemataceae bacterium]|nr:flagellar assembly protein FliH [Rectinemataceae bacterium]
MPTKHVFRPGEIVSLQTRMVVGQESAEEAKVAKVEDMEAVEVPEYTGPTADDLRREAELFKSSWDAEREAMIGSAKAEAGAIVKEAEAAAFEEVRRKSNEALKIRKEAEEAAARLVAEAESRVAELESKAGARVEAAEREAAKRGRDAGREEGFKEGRAEVERLVGRLHVILDRAMEKRGEILEQAEVQVIELVLLVAKKVVKVISENQKSVVVQNIQQALRKLKTKSDVIVRVNLADLELATEHVKDFVAMAENARKMSIVEDTTVDRGGCVIETDFGEIDARIASQLSELEDRILEVAPIRARGKVQS